MEGLLGAGAGYRRMADYSINQAADMERTRNQENKMAQQGRRTNQITGTVTGATTGFMLGGPIGAGIGAIVGFAGGSF